MIRINNELAVTAAQIHLKACKPDIEHKLLFLSDLFGALINPTNEKFKDDEDFKDKYKFSRIDAPENLLKPILIKNTNIRLNELNNIFKLGELSYFNLEDKLITEIKSTLDKIIKHLDDILIGKPSKLIEIYNEICKGITSEFKPLKDILEKIFSYEKLTSNEGFVFNENQVWNSYQLTIALKINVCPYCNKNWTNTVIDKNKKKVTNPQLDHFFPKGKFPLLRLSFYNLVPSCETCNARIKKESYLPLDHYVHPYVQGFDPSSTFLTIAKNSLSAQGEGEEFHVFLEHDKNQPKEDFYKAVNNFDFFKIQDIYEQHGDIISEIYFRKLKYNISSLSHLLKHDMFQGMTVSEAYRMAFGNYFEEEKFNSRPFAKLTRDTLKSLGVDVSDKKLI